MLLVRAGLTGRLSSLHYLCIRFLEKRYIRGRLEVKSNEGPCNQIGICQFALLLLCFHDSGLPDFENRP